jgi:hypothetical protein
MFIVNSLQPNISIDPNRIKLLRNATLQSSLTFDEIMDITKSPYTDETWVQLVYFLSKHKLRPYYNNVIGKIADQKIANGDWIIDEMSVNCLLFETYLRMPSVCDWTRHFLYFNSSSFLGLFDVYSLNLSTDVSEHMALKQISHISQHQLQNNSPFQRFMVAIQKIDRWELALGEILPINVPIKFVKSRRVRITVFNDPSRFFHELLRRGKANNIPHKEYEIAVRI